MLNQHQQINESFRYTKIRPDDFFNKSSNNQESEKKIFNLKNGSVLDIHNMKIITIGDEINDGILISHDNDIVNIKIVKNKKYPLLIDNIKNNTTIKISISSDIFINIIDIISYGDKKSTIDIDIQKNSILNLYRLYLSPINSKVWRRNHINIGQNSLVKLVDLGFDQGEICLDTCFKLSKESTLNYFGLDFLKSHSNRHHSLNIFHEEQESKSQQIFRGFYNDQSFGTFLGKVIVEKNASLSEAHQSYKAIIEGSLAKAFVRPQLEINNSEIKATHGATIGALDENSLFYLCSRGFSLEEAKALLIQSVAFEILDHVDVDDLKNTVQDIFSLLLEGKLNS